MANGDQNRNGHAFEYSLASQYYDYLRENGALVELLNDDIFCHARDCYASLPFVERKRFDYCSALTIDTMLKLEPGIAYKGDPQDVLHIRLNGDIAGASADVRDVVFSRDHKGWSVGFSAKNNNDAVKHSRLGRSLDFGKSWFGVPCSDVYWNEASAVFDYVERFIGQDWSDLGNDKARCVYKPLLKAFRKELLRICEQYEEIPQALLVYLVGSYDFYKIIKDDNSKVVVVKAVNIHNKLNLTYRSIKPRLKTPCLTLPTRIIEMRFKDGSDNTMILTMDHGWTISFRIHSAATKVERSLKFDISLIGNPPVLFSQYLFEDDEIN